MKLAIVTLPTGDAGRAAQSMRELVPPLRALCAIELFVEDGREASAGAGETTRAVSTLRVQDFDQLVFDVDDDARHAFMAPVVRELGGIVVLRSWSLVNLAFALHPELAGGGWRGRWSALREGGLRQAISYGRGLRAGSDAHEAAGSSAGRSALERVQARSDLILNRSIVRNGDAFIVHEPELVRRILLERNAATPIAVLPHSPTCSVASDQAGLSTSLQPRLDEPQREQAWRFVADEWFRQLETFPPPRSKRRSLVQSLVDAADRNRAR